MNGLVLRADQAAYMNTGTGTTATYSRIGEGFTTFAESKNPKEYTRQYIHMTQEQTDVIGYSPSIGYSCDVYDDDPCCTKIVTITDNELVGEDAQIDVVIVDLYKEDNGTAPARKRTYSVVPDSVADGTEALVYTGNLRAVTAFVEGTFTIATSTFAPNP